MCFSSSYIETHVELLDCVSGVLSAEVLHNLYIRVLWETFILPLQQLSAPRVPIGSDKVIPLLLFELAQVPF